jgi:hypothetical protein
MFSRELQPHSYVDQRRRDPVAGKKAGTFEMPA